MKDETQNDRPAGEGNETETAQVGEEGRTEEVSYDLRIGVKVEGLGKVVPIGSPELDGPTYNLGKMFRECTEWDFNQGEWYNCKEVLPKIRYGMMMLATAPSHYKQYEPENGWGTVNTALYTLNSLHDCITDWAETIPLEYLWVRW